MAYDGGEAVSGGVGNQGPPYGYDAANGVGTPGGQEELVMLDMVVGGGGTRVVACGQERLGEVEEERGIVGAVTIDLLDFGAPK
ncbi:hypothetical protein E2562_008700 [Oryza meyeriana var. granulata]|uniref:Uncharacterized protein n=1 Tax=Oryza meyeriana var. granulata TaxID=110450 RepID=A0A6G1F5Q6_9ORYZ|nr:hypothetical protein E2562_008700 [Oryza meyeriana var. granulata]